MAASNPLQLSLEIRLDESICLENFISCNSTSHLLKILKNSVRQDSVLMQFFLWGNEGVGKTYLIHALTKEFLKKNESYVYLSFKDKRINSTKILDGLEEVDTVFIDDLNYCNFSEEWEISLFNLINRVFINEKKIYISSINPAKDLDLKLPDLISRLNSFTALEIPDIDDVEKFKALRESALRKGIDLDNKVIDFIIRHTSRRLSDLLSLIDELDSFSLQKQRKITIPLINELLKNKEDSQST
tara:strand:+ start:80105 stop:80836 length:732 start_codon:yes stop_codon:yes gene_type:complete